MENLSDKKAKYRSASLLLVDDNAELLSGLKLFLSPWFDSIDVIRNPNLIPSKIQNFRYDVIMLDMNFTAEITSGNEGIYWLRQIIESEPDSVVVMITAYGDIELAVKAIKEGATDFISKSWEEEKILSTLISALKLSHSKKEIKKLKTQQKHLAVNEEQGYSVFKSKARSMTGILKCIEKTAPTDANILILGENGTGKEVVAREIHRLSKRSDNIFVHIDLGSLSEPLFESELFGYKKGAFTDAKEDKPGRIEIASGGSLLLDEIGNLPLHQQTKLLSVIQNQEIIPLGGTRPVGVDVRMISATNSPLESMIEEGRFREDLYFRINTIRIEVPPLRERKEDIAGFANYFLKRFAARYKTDTPAISEKAAEKLLSYNWPGNIRELMHTIEKAVILAEDNILKPEDFTLNDKVKKHGHNSGSFNISENEKYLIESAIETFNGNMSRVARELGINRSTLYEKIKRYNTSVPGNN